VKRRRRINDVWVKSKEKKNEKNKIKNRIKKSRGE